MPNLEVFAACLVLPPPTALYDRLLGMWWVLALENVIEKVVYYTACTTACAESAILRSTRAVIVAQPMKLKTTRFRSTLLNT